MKKIVALILAATMVFSLAACGKNADEVTPDSNTTTNQTTTETNNTEDTTPVEDVDVDEEEAVTSTEPERLQMVEEAKELKTQAEVLAMIPDVAPTGQIVVGSVTEANADMFPGWTNIAVNSGVKKLLSGYNTLVFTKEGRYEYDPIVVKDYEETENADGTKTFTIEIYDNLTWNEGTNITAKDYVFSALLFASPEFGAVDGSNIGNYETVGFENFNTGHVVNADGLAVDKDGNVIEFAVDPIVDEEGNEVAQDNEIRGELVPCKTFSGIRLLGDYKFSITIKAEELPFYYDRTLAVAGPVPMFAIAPGCDITDSESGVTISDNFTADLLRQTLLDPETGFRYKNPITCGSYSFTSFDPSDSTIVLTANPYFLGNHDGTKPQIEKIICKTVAEATRMDELEAGTVDLIYGVNGGDNITAGLDLVDAGLSEFSSYPRAGYGKIEVACDFGPTQFVEVRQALAYLIDRDEFARQFTGGYGTVVDGYYGLSQWEYQENKDLLDELLTHYTLNPDKAKELLISNGWTLNKDGAEFVEGTDTLRYKEVNGALMPLTLQWCSTNNAVSALLRTLLLPNVSLVGMEIVETIVDFPTLIANLYRDGIDEPVYHIFNLATGFAEQSAVWYYYSTDPMFFGEYNTTRIVDPEMEGLTVEMKRTEASDLDGWSEKWVKFQQRWNYLVTEVPLYSDEYHDFYSSKLENYTPGPLWQWHYALERASIK